MKRRQERADKKGDDLPIEVKFNKKLRAARDNYLEKGKATLSDVQLKSLSQDVRNMDSVAKTEFLHIGTSKKGQDNVAYENYFSAKEGVIIGSKNFNKHDGGKDDPGRLPNSEIFYNQLRLAAREQGIPMENVKIKQIIGNNLTNKEFHTINPLVRNGSENKNFAKGSDGYHILLNSPAIKGKLYLCRDHPELFNGHSAPTALELRGGNDVVYHFD